MVISVKHKFQSAKADGGDASVVRPSNWNDTHDLTLAASKLLGRYAGTDGAAQEVGLGTGLEFNGADVQVKDDYVLKAGGVHSLTEKVTITDADEFLIGDVADSNNLKRVTAFNVARYVATALGFVKVSGCETVYVSTTTIQMKAGYVVFNGRRTTLSLLTKALNATFVAGNGNGMLDTGVMQASKTYFIHAVRNTASGAGDWVASLQSDPALVTMTNLTGWTVEGRVNVVLTTSGNVIRPYVQDGNEYRLVTGVTELNGSFAVQDIQFTTAPAGISTEIFYMLTNSQNSNSSGSVSIWAEATSGPAMGILLVNVVQPTEVRIGQRTKTRSTGVVRAQIAESVGSGTLTCQMQGFEDYTVPRY